MQPDWRRLTWVTTQEYRFGEIQKGKMWSVCGLAAWVSGIGVLAQFGMEFVCLPKSTENFDRHAFLGTLRKMQNLGGFDEISIPKCWRGRCAGFFFFWVDALLAVAQAPKVDGRWVK